MFYYCSFGGVKRAAEPLRFNPGTARDDLEKPAFLNKSAERLYEEASCPLT